MVIMGKLLTVFICILSINCHAVHRNNVTSSVKLLGNPFLKETYARNVWAMQAWHHKIYFGHGNSSNLAPSSNAGPVPIYAFNPATGLFTTDFTVDDEQIDIFRVIDGVLTIQGHDPRESWDFGNYYQLGESGWTKTRNIPGGIHAFDIYSFNGLWFAALGPNVGVTDIVVSSDDGQSWNNATGYDFGFARIYSLFELGGTLYGATSAYGDSVIHILQYNSGVDFTEIDASAMGKRIARPTNYLGKLVYVNALPVNDQQWVPIGLNVSAAMGSADTVALPNGALPRDIKVGQDDALYVLGSKQNDDSTWTISVTQTTDLVHWNEVLSFTQDTFARSFEQMDGYFYFGLGCETDVLPDSTGNILRVAVPSCGAPGARHKCK